MNHINFCHVYRDAVRSTDCTNGGVTAHNDTVTVITDVPYRYTEFDGKAYPDRPNEERVMDYVRTYGLDPWKTLILCDRQSNPIYTPYLKPLDAVYKKAGCVGPMFGGNYVELPHMNAIRVHDRYETQAENETLSR